MIKYIAMFFTLKHKETSPVLFRKTFDCPKKCWAFVDAMMDSGFKKTHINIIKVEEDFINLDGLNKEVLHLE